MLCHVHASHYTPYESLPKPWSAHLSLTRRCDIVHTNSHTILLGHYPGCVMHHNFDKHQPSGDDTNLDYCEVMTITSNFGMIIITLDIHYSTLSCQPAPPDALSASCGWCADNRGTCTLLGPMSYRGVGFKAFWDQALSELKVHEQLPRGEPRP
jgi:hypothetical protein